MVENGSTTFPPCELTLYFFLSRHFAIIIFFTSAPPSHSAHHPCFIPFSSLLSSLLPSLFFFARSELARVVFWYWQATAAVYAVGAVVYGVGYRAEPLALPSKDS